MMRAVFSRQVLKAQTHIYVWAHLSMFLLQRVILENQHQYSINIKSKMALYVWLSGASQEAFMSLLHCSEADGTERQRLDCVRQIPPSISVTHMGHTCLHLSSKPMCPSLPHPCSHHILL